MKNVFKIALCTATLAALALTSCTQERAYAPDEVTPDGAVAADFSTSATRVSNDTQWDGNEVIGISNLTKQDAATTNAAYKATSAGVSTKFTAQGTELMLPADNSEIKFSAYYPRVASLKDGKTAEYTISSGDVQPVLYAEQSGTADHPQIPFTFRHKLAKIKVILTAEEGLDLTKVTAVAFKGGLTKASLDVLTGTLTPGTDKGDVTLTKGTENYASYIVPQTIDKAALSFVITLDGKAYTLQFADVKNFTSTDFAAAKSYTFTIKLMKNGTVSGDFGDSTIEGPDEGGSGEGDATGGDEDPQQPGEAQTLPYSKDFANATEFAPFTTLSISGDQKWIIDIKYKNGAKMSGHAGGAVANEDWLISPAIDLSGATSPMMTIYHAINYATDMENQQAVLISKDYAGGDPSAATWTPLTVTYPAGDSWDYITSETDLTAYAGEANIHIAFKYVSTDTEAATWEIKTFEVKEAGGTEEPTPDPDPDPTPDPSGAKPLFPGADFEDFAAFEGTLAFPLKHASEGTDEEQGGTLHIAVDSASKNDYVFTVANTEIPVENPSKITFKLKGTADGRSISINVHSSDTEFAIYNLGDVSSDVTIAPASQNSYVGNIDTNGEWITITLDLTGVKLNTTGTGNVLALKIGKGAPFDVMLDDFMVE